MLAVLIVAALLRFWALDFGLPNLTRPDEQNISRSVVMVLMASFFGGEPSLNPHFFHYPSLYLYLVAILYTLYFLLGHLTGLFPDAVSLISLYLDNWRSFLVISRSLTALFGVASIWAMVQLGRCLLGSATAGLLAGLLLAVTHLHVRDSHWGVTDITATFWVILCLWQALKGYQQRQARPLYWAAVLAGLAASTKYPCGLVALAPLSAFYLWHRDEGLKLGGILSRTPLVKQLLLLMGGILGAFLLTSPFVLLDFNTFLAQFQSQQDLFKNLHAHHNLPSGWLRHLTFSLWYGLGGMYLITGLLGMTLALFSRQKRHVILLGFAFAYYLIIGSSPSSYVRYVLPLVPVFCLYAVYALQWLIARLPQPTPAFTVATWTVLWLLVGGPSLFYSLRFDWLISQPDTRSQARQWLIAHLNPEDGVGIGKALSHIDLPRQYRKYFLSPAENQRFPLGSPERYPEHPEFRAKDEPNERYEFNISTYTNVEALRERGIRYVTLAGGPLSQYQAPPQELARVAQNPGLRLVKIFSPVPQGTPLPNEKIYDHIDAFYVPYAKLGNVTHPGPEIRIYQVLPAPSPAQ